MTTPNDKLIDRTDAWEERQDAEKQQAFSGRTLIDNEVLADLYKKCSGKKIHASDCATSCAPAETPGPCDCEVRQQAPACAHNQIQRCKGNNAENLYVCGRCFSEFVVKNYEPPTVTAEPFSTGKKPWGLRDRQA